MLRWLLRWVIRLAVTAVLVLIVAALMDYFEHRVQPNSVLVLRLSGQVLERANAGWLGSLRGGERTGLNQVRRALEMARQDDRIVGLAVKVIDPSMEMAQAQEIASLIEQFRASGKWTSAYIESAGESGPGNLDYLVASAAGEVSLMPQGELNIIGVQVRELFMRGTLDWLGVNPEIYAIGAYKTAGNIFTQKDFTPAQREEDTSLVNDLYAQLVAEIAAQRHLQTETLQQLIDRAPLSAEDGLQAHLVDRMEYEDQFDNRIKQHGGGAEHPLIAYDVYARPHLLSFSSGPRIAVVYGNGAIDRGRSGFDPLLSPEQISMGSQTMAEAFQAVRNDNSVKAIVFRIDSPGGSVVASELIRREVELTAAVKPVIISMSGYAASGGYWIATPGQMIFAEPGTITGSIGVLGGKFNVAAAAAKIGINTDAVARGNNVAMFDSFTDFTADQAAYFHDHLLGDVYRAFVAKVAASRHLTVAQVDKIAQGRMWTGRQALGIKLIDRLGGLEEAIAEAKARAHLAANQSVTIVSFPRQPGLLEQLAGVGGAEDGLAGIDNLAQEATPLLRIISRQRALAGAAGLLYDARLPVVR